MKRLNLGRLNHNLSEYVSSLDRSWTSISSERRALLEKMAWFIREKQKAGGITRLTFICTHNSRRSHFGQAWAQVAAHCYGIEKVSCYSGGTEATAANPRTVAALQRAGLQVEKALNGENPHYRLLFAEGEMPVVAFSKVYHSPVNPSSDFVAVLTCSQADEECPFIPGATLRIALPYEDPKLSDDSPAEEATYDERCRQIALEMFYLFEYV